MMFKKLSIYAVALIGAITVLSSCEKEYESIESIDESKLTQYIASNNLQVTKDPSGFYYQIVNPGTGDNYKNTDSVLYNVEIISLQGKTYYTTESETNNIATMVGYSERIVQRRSVPAVRTAILALKRGGSVNVLLPSYMVFGKNGDPDLNIPSNEPLILAVTTLQERSQPERDENVIKAFLQRNNLTATRDTSGVYYIISKPGAGPEINAESTLYPFYTGRLLDGTEFGSNKDTTVTLPLKSQIKGWQRVVPLIKQGGKMRILVPSGLAYGGAGTTGIKGNAVLDFDIEPWKVKN